MSKLEAGTIDLWPLPCSSIAAQLSNHELCYSISKLIGNEEDTLKSFMAFDITSRGLVFRVVIGSQIVVLQ